MACGGCSRAKHNPVKKDVDLMGGFKYLTDRQIKARLEAYKRKFCKNCENKFGCDYKSYLGCKNK